MEKKESVPKSKPPTYAQLRKLYRDKIEENEDLKRELLAATRSLDALATAVSNFQVARSCAVERGKTPRATTRSKPCCVPSKEKYGNVSADKSALRDRSGIDCCRLQRVLRQGTQHLERSSKRLWLRQTTAQPTLCVYSSR